MSRRRQILPAPHAAAETRTGVRRWVAAQARAMGSNKTESVQEVRVRAVETQRQKPSNRQIGTTESRERWAEMQEVALVGGRALRREAGKERV